MTREATPAAPRWIGPAPATAGRVSPSTLAGRFVALALPDEHARELLVGMDRMQAQDATWHPLAYTSPAKAPFRLFERHQLATFRSKKLGRALKQATHDQRWISLAPTIELPEKKQLELTAHEVHIEQERAYFIASVDEEGWRLECHAFTRADLLTHLLWTAPAEEVGSLLARLATSDADRALQVLEAGAVRPEAGKGGPVRKLTSLLTPGDLTTLLRHTNPRIRRACLGLLAELTGACPPHVR